MKKNILLIFMLCFMGCCFVACGISTDEKNPSSNEPSKSSEDEKKVTPVEEESNSNEDETAESEKENLSKTKENEPVEAKDSAAETTPKKEEAEETETNNLKEKSEEESELTTTELEETLLQQPCYIERIDYANDDITGDGNVCIVVKNNSGTDIKNVFYAMAGWDNNNLPLILYTYKRIDGTGYVVENDFGDANIIDGGTYGEDLLFGIMERTASRLKTIKAVVIKYEDFDGNIWENPYYSDWIEKYKEKRLEQ